MYFDNQSDLLDKLPGLRTQTRAHLNAAQVTNVGHLLQQVPIIDLIQSCNVVISSLGTRRQLILQPGEKLIRILRNISATLIFSVGGSVRLHLKGTRLLVEDIWKLYECLTSIREDKFL